MDEVFSLFTNEEEEYQKSLKENGISLKTLEEKDKDIIYERYYNRQDESGKISMNYQIIRIFAKEREIWIMTCFVPKEKEDNYRQQMLEMIQSGK